MAHLTCSFLLRIAIPEGDLEFFNLSAHRGNGRFRRKSVAKIHHSCSTQGALKGTELRCDRERESPKCRFSQKIADFRRFTLLLEIGGRRKPQKTADFRRKPQETADWAPSP